MPSFAGALTGEQMAALLTYIRTDLGQHAAWKNVQDEVQKVMREMEQC